MVIAPQVFWNLLKFINQKNSFTTFARIGFANKCEFWMLFHIRFKTWCFFRQEKTYWWKSKLFVESFSHSICDWTKYFLASHILNQGVSVIIELVLAHSFEILVIQSQRKPIQISTDRCFFESLLENHMLKKFELRSAIWGIDDEYTWAIIDFLIFTFHWLDNRFCLDNLIVLIALRIRWLWFFLWVVSRVIIVTVWCIIIAVWLHLRLLSQLFFLLLSSLIIFKIEDIIIIHLL